MQFKNLSCQEFVDILASKEPVPGGGGASALVGAVGTALGNMVGSLTVGKKKYAHVQEDILALKEKADTLQGELLALIEQDALAFAPLAKAYGLPKDTMEQKQEKARIMEAALKEACSVPLKIMKKCCEGILLHQEFAQKGTAIAISDVGVGVIFCKAALFGASLNVFINTKAMKDRDYAAKLETEAEEMLAKYGALAEAIYNQVQARIRD